MGRRESGGRKHSQPIERRTGSRVQILLLSYSLGVYLLECIEGCMEEEAVRWNIKVSKETVTLRTFLAAQGAKKGNYLPKKGRNTAPS